LKAESILNLEQFAMSSKSRKPHPFIHKRN